MRKEAQARIKINKLLEEAGWRFLDDATGKANVVLENHIKITEQHIDAFGNDFEKTRNGFIDFLLLDNKGFPLAVLEAKSEDKDPLVGKEQARQYALAQKVRFIILSNGNLHFFWDLESGNPTAILRLPSIEHLTTSKSINPDPATLANEVIDCDYVVLTQAPTYQIDPLWIEENTRDVFKKEHRTRFPFKEQAEKRILSLFLFLLRLLIETII